MQIIPAIDVLGGQVVRLWQGDFGAATFYGDSPAEQIAAWRSAGADWVHVIDLDGARSGSPSRDLWQQAAGQGGSVQLGGGIRTMEDVEGALATGISRVIMGTTAVWTPEVLEQAVALGSPERVMAAVDVKDGMASGEGWLDQGRDFQAVIEGVLQAGVTGMLVTAVSRDGTLHGPDLELLSQVRKLAPGAYIQAAGGIGSVEDLRRLKGAGMDGAVIGRALYEGAFDLSAVLQEFAV